MKYYLHMIWVGGARVPLEIIKTWVPTDTDNYELILWRDCDPKTKYERNISTIRDFRHKKLYNTTSKNNQKSDILRLEILRLFGGIYMDCDIFRYSSVDPMESLRSYGENKDGFYITYEKARCVSNSIIGVETKMNSIICYLSNLLTDCVLFDAHGKYHSVWKTTGPQFVTNSLIKYGWGFEQVLPCYIVNFGIDFAKTFAREDFKITSDMSKKGKNKDLTYMPVFDNILGIQLWMGGKKIAYDAITEKQIAIAKLNSQKYIDHIKSIV